MKICVLLVVCILFGCIESKQVTDNNVVSSKLKTIALIPTYATFLFDAKQKTKVPQAQIDEAELKLGFMIQSELNKGLEKNKNKYSISIQNIKTTNELLFANGNSFKNFLQLSKDSLARFLHVDAILFCDVTLARKFSDTEYNVLLAVGAPSSIFGITMGGKYDIKVKFGIAETSNTNILWQRDYSPTGKIDEDIFSTLRRTIKKAVRDFPYKK